MCAPTAEAGWWNKVKDRLPVPEINVEELCINAINVLKTEINNTVENEMDRLCKEVTDKLKEGAEEGEEGLTPEEFCDEADGMIGYMVRNELQDVLGTMKDNCTDSFHGVRPQDMPRAMQEWVQEAGEHLEEVMGPVLEEYHDHLKWLLKQQLKDRRPRRKHRRSPYEKLTLALRITAVVSLVTFLWALSHSPLLPMSPARRGSFLGLFHRGRSPIDFSHALGPPTKRRPTSEGIEMLDYVS